MMFATATITDAIKHIGGKGTPPQIAQRLGVSADLWQVLSLTRQLEVLRANGRLSVVWNELGNGFYKVIL